MLGLPLKPFRLVLGAAAFAGLFLTSLLAGPSIFLQRPPDPQAIEFARPRFEVHADGKGDDAPALQAAIDQVNSSPARRGIIFIGPGTYRLGTTVNVWRGVRLIGYGEHRPVFLLGPSTPGFQGPDSRYLFFFAGDQARAGRPVRDGGASGFFATLTNVDVEIAEGNPAAVGVRFHVAQHSFLSHIDFRLGSARAGVEEVGNLFHHCTFTGGDFGIIAHRTAPAWPFVLIDSTFSGQRTAAIRTEEAGMTIVRGQFRDMPRAIEVNSGRPEQLWVRDSLFERIAGPAITLSDSANSRTQGNLQNVICRGVPVLLALEGGETVRGIGESYLVSELTHGLQSAGPGGESELKTRSQLGPLPPGAALPPSDIAALPPVADWVDARTLGVKGDGTTDDTVALQRALQEHPAVYLPSGKYIVSDTLRLRPDGVLIGLHSSTTQLVAAVGAPAFEGEGAPVPILATARGGRAVLSGVGVDMGVSRRVVGVEWRAGAQSMVEDVCFASSHSARGERPAAEQRSAWNTQSHSLWVRDGGGGTFVNIWTANTTARSGLFISDTETPGRVYVLSAEHHVLHEVQLERVSHWSFYGLQTEAEGEEGPADLALEIKQGRDLLFANLFIYRVSRTRTPYPTAIETTDCDNVQVRGLLVFSPTKFAYDYAVRDIGSGRVENGRLWARLTIDRTPAPARKPPAGVEVKRLATGYESIDGVVVAPTGEVCFIDGREGKIYQWQPDSGVRLRAETSIRPAALAMDPKTGGLLVISHAGEISRLVEKPGVAPEATPLAPVKHAEVAADTSWLRPTNLYDPGSFLEMAARKGDTAWQADSVAIPIERITYEAGNRAPSWANDPLWRAFNLKIARPGKDFFVADEYRQKTYRFHVGADGRLAAPQLFAEVGDADIAQDAAGRIYVAAGDIFIFDQGGHRLGRIPLPERALSLAFGGPSQRTLFVAARASLYAVKFPAD